jgi:hypothetical protein
MEVEKYKCTKTLSTESNESFVKGKSYWGYPAESKFGYYWKILVNDRLFLNVSKAKFNNHFKKVK